MDENINLPALKIPLLFCCAFPYGNNALTLLSVRNVLFVCHGFQLCFLPCAFTHCLFILFERSCTFFEEITQSTDYDGRREITVKLAVHACAETIEEQQIYDVKELKEFFWNMFIADCLVGNFDRHNGNWGFLINESQRKIEIAPIYDCASCLYPQLTDERITEIINDEEEMEARVFVFPTSALKINDKKINYFEYINGLENEECNDALFRIFPKIDLGKINKIIDETPFISNIRKEFYKKIIQMRYEKILKYSYEKVCR